MPNDARLGLVVGVTLVILVAVLFARKEGVIPGSAGVIQATPAASPEFAAPVPGLPGVPPKASTQAAGLPRAHKVEEGESLMSLAVRYYGNSGHVSFLFRANQDRILSPDRIPIGTVLRIPDLPPEQVAKTGR
jgi:nucleoid-associated protein YgaU